MRDVPTELLRRIHGYYWNDWDSDRVGSGAFQFKLFVPTLYEPQLAPPGSHVIVMQKVIDRALQVHGGLGMTDDTILAFYYRHERAARIYDGADEVHKISVAKRILKEYEGKRVK